MGASENSLKKEDTKEKTVDTTKDEVLSKPTLTYGQKLVGINFNPSADGEVDRCKQTFANSIDQMDALRKNTESAEVKRMCSIAITRIQTAQMWAVKAITWKD